MAEIKVLLIEGNPDDACLIQREFDQIRSRIKIRLECVKTLEEGIASLAADRFQTVLVDLSLPDSRGLATLQRIVLHAPHIPVIVVTGQADEEMGLQAVQYGAQDYLIKGRVDGELLTRAIQYAMQRKQIEMQLADAHEFTGRILTSSPIGIFTYRFTGECLSVNAAAAQMVGATVEQLQGQNFRELESWKRSGLYDLAERAIASKTLVADDVHVITTFGRDAWYRAQFTTFKSAADELLLMIFSDITEHKRTEFALRESEENYRQLFEAESDAILLIENETGRILQANQAASILYGYSQKELLSLHDIDLSAEVEQTREFTQNTPIIPEHVITIPHRLHRRKDGSVFPVELTARFFMRQNYAVHLLAVRDSTARKAAEAAVTTLQKRFQALIEHAPDGIVLLGLDGKLRQVTPSTYQILGYTVEQSEGQDPATMTHPDDLPGLLAQLSELIQNPGQVIRTQYRFKHKDGSWRWLESIISNLIAEPSVEAIVFNYRDVTDGKQAAATLQEKEHLVSESQRIGHVGSWSYDVVKGAMQFSDEMYRLLDIAPQEFEHQPVNLLELVYSADREKLRKWFKETLEGQSAKEVQFRIFRRNGELRYLQTRGAVVLDAAGKPARFTGTVQDITETKLAEIQIRQQMNRLHSLRRIDQAIASSFDRRFTLNVILHEVQSQLQVDVADILILDASTQALTYAAGKGFRTNLVEAASVPFGHSHAGRAAREKRMIQVPDLNERRGDSALQLLAHEEGLVSLVCVPLIVKGSVNGVLEVFHRQPFQPYEEWLDFLHVLAGQTAIAVENAALFTNLRSTNDELFKAYDATIEGWSRAMDLRDPETENHTQRVTELTLELGRAMNIDESQLVHIRRGALLHDIGKLGVPDDILFKADQLTPEEWQIMQKHPEHAYALLSPIHYLKPALPIPYFHHEKWDGSGYPLGLKGEQIPLEARIFAIVDVWDSLTSDRPYRPAWTREVALEYIREQKGKHFDPTVVDVFLQVVG